jgi:hypothetical protein
LRPSTGAGTASRPRRRCGTDSPASEAVLIWALVLLGSFLIILQRALWIGGGQWAGKSTVAGILAERHGLTHYHYDYHDARSHLSSPQRMIVMVPTEDFRQHQRSQLQRAGALRHDVSDPELAQRNRIARDRLIAEDAVRSAKRLTIRVIEVDGSRDAQTMAGLVAEHFRDFLP